MAKGNPTNPPTGGQGTGGGNHPFKIKVVVAGDDQKLNVKPNDLAEDVLREALKKTKNDGQPFENWELKDEDGNPYALASTLAALGIVEGAVLYATLKAGVVG